MTAGQSHVTTSNFPSLGSDMARGIATGIANDGTVAAAMRKVVQDALAAGRAAAGAASPAKLFKYKLGVTFPQGIAAGVEQDAYLVYAALEEVVENAANIASGDDSQFVSAGKRVLTGAPGSGVGVEGTTQDVPSSGAGSRTYIFNGTPPLDEVETARQIRLTEQKIAEDML